VSTAHVIGILTAVCLSFVAYLTVLASAGLGDLPGENSKRVETSPEAGSGAAPPTSPGATGEQGGTKEVAHDIKFQNTKLTAVAGKVTIDFDNQDSTAHNFHLFTKKGGDSLGQTDIKPGPATSQLAVNLQAGKYYFQCDVHPDQMNGELDVN
jgi:plastocyanin